MKEHDLPTIAKLYMEMEEINGKIKESRERAPDLVMAYLVEPFEAEDKAGKKSVHNSIDVGPSLGIAPGDIRAAAVNMIEDLLNNKIQEIKLKLKKLGVKLEEPPTPKTAQVLRLTGPKMRKES